MNHVINGQVNSYLTYIYIYIDFMVKFSTKSFLKCNSMYAIRRLRISTPDSWDFAITAIKIVLLPKNKFGSECEDFC